MPGYIQVVVRHILLKRTHNTQLLRFQSQSIVTSQKQKENVLWANFSSDRVIHFGYNKHHYLKNISALRNIIQTKLLHYFEVTSLH